MERVEVGDAVEVEHHGLAIDDEPRMPVLQRRFDKSTDNGRPSCSRRG
jgi:hypothetical protein